MDAPSPCTRGGELTSLVSLTSTAPSFTATPLFHTVESQLLDHSSCRSCSAPSTLSAVLLQYLLFSRRGRVHCTCRCVKHLTCKRRKADGCTGRSHVALVTDPARLPSRFTAGEPAVTIRHSTYSVLGLRYPQCKCSQRYG